ncbi:hypothetical protein [Sphingomonas sp. 37zxx]|uniref:hypothetical protein n=1 Tax=Sphingomonas sp. 37zxx TaxID=1550073 RepID=UPI00053BE453|nr:hypothetical protein [Sphingomonas sp. 37zxx]
MLEIAGGILLAVAVLAVVMVAFRYIVLALSAGFCIALVVGAWLLLSPEMGGWWAAILLLTGFGIWFWMVNHDDRIEGREDASPDRFARASRQRRLSNGEPPAAYVLDAWHQRHRIARNEVKNSD